MQPKGRFSYGMQFIPQDSTLQPKVMGVVDPAGDGVGSARVSIYGNADGTPIDDYAFFSGDGLQFDAALATVNFLYGFNGGSSWDRIRSFAGNADNVVAPTLGLMGSASFLLAFDGATYDRVRAITPADADSNVTGLIGATIRNTFFNGATFDRGRSISSTNLALTAQIGVQAVAPPGNWSITNTPAVNAQATISRAAVASTRHVCTSISARITADAASVSGTLQVNLRNGATGAGTILWSETVKVGAAASVTAESADIKLSGLSIFGSVNTAMTLEFSAAGGATTIESVSLTGYDVA